jgi:hypothetical protein
MIQVSLDTSFLISFADPDRPNHTVAVDYFRHCLVQAEEESIPVILTEDRNTLSRLTDRLRQLGHTIVHVLLLIEGFSPGRIENPAQNELRLPNTPQPVGQQE